MRKAKAEKKGVEGGKEKEKKKERKERRAPPIEISGYATDYCRPKMRQSSADSNWPCMYQAKADGWA